MNKIQTGWALIPPYIIANPDLSANEKLIFGRILGLTGNKGYCFASNRWLGEQLGLDEGTTANIISSLKKKSLIQTQVTRNDVDRTVSRHIFVRNFTEELTPLHSPVNTPSLSNEEERGHTGTPSVDLSVERVVVSENSSDENSNEMENMFSKRKQRHEKKSHNSFNGPKSIQEKPKVSGSLEPLSKLEWWEIAKHFSVAYFDVRDIHEDVLRAIADGKYNISDTRRAVESWISRGIRDNKIEVLSEWQQISGMIDDWHPDEVERRRKIDEYIKNNNL